MPNQSTASNARRALLLIGKPELTGLDAVEALRARLRDQSTRVREMTLKQWLDGADGSAGGETDLVVAVGGDGTVRTAAEAAYAAGARLAILPTGTANDLARTLDLPLRPERAVELLDTGRWRRIDLGRCNGQIFCNVASLGLSAKVAQRLTGERKKRWGPLAYAREMMDSLRTFRSLRVALDLDGVRRHYRALQVGIASGVTQGGGTRVAPGARIDDGRFQVYVVEPQPLPRLLAMALSLKLGAHDLWDGAHFHAARRVRVAARGAHEVNIDGDLLTRTPIEAEILPGAIEVLVPAETREDEEAAA